MVAFNMKIRKGFVSNSSSSSFVIDKMYLTDTQMEFIRNAVEIAKNYTNIDTYDQPWEIIETDDTISGTTSMDNFDMAEFLTEIGVNSNFIDWNHGHW